MVIKTNYFILSIQICKRVDILLTNLLKSSVKKVFQWDEYWNELSSGPFRQSNIPVIVLLSWETMSQVSFKIHCNYPQKPWNYWKFFFILPWFSITNGFKCYKHFTGNFGFVGKQDNHCTWFLNRQNKINSRKTITKTKKVMHINNIHPKWLAADVSNKYRRSSKILTETTYKAYFTT